MTFSSRSVAAVCATLAFVAGCGGDDQIKTYTIAPPESGEAVSLPTEPEAPKGEPTDRMIAAIVDGGSRAWFFKAVGPTDQLEAASEAITAFFTRVQLESDKPTWELPEGWSEKQGGAMRLATLVAPVGEGQLEISVIGLPKAGSWEAQVLDNVNRWRRQLGLAAIDGSELKSETKPIDSVSAGSVVVDMTGWFDGGSMPPFAGGGAAPFAGRSAPPAAPAPPRSNELEDEAPEGWVAEPGSALRKASYKTAAGSVVTAFAFPATAPAMSDPLANVNRWRGEIGLDPITREEMIEQTKPITLLGEKAVYFELQGAEESTLAAMIKQGQRVWFFKLRGPNDAVATDGDAFRAWLDTLRINSGAGRGDG